MEMDIDLEPKGKNEGGRCVSVLGESVGGRKQTQRQNRADDTMRLVPCHYPFGSENFSGPAGMADRSLCLLVRLSAQGTPNSSPRSNVCAAGCLAVDLD